MKGVSARARCAGRAARQSHSCHRAATRCRRGFLACGRRIRGSPQGTVHVAVVNPGVGSTRAALALHADFHFFVGPDNGIFEGVLRRAARVQMPAPSHHGGARPFSAAESHLSRPRRVRAGRRASGAAGASISRAWGPGAQPTHESAAVAVRERNPAGPPVKWWSSTTSAT